jgi:hypothetical protein
MGTIISAVHEGVMQDSFPAMGTGLLASKSYDKNEFY